MHWFWDDGYGDRTVCGEPAPLQVYLEAGPEVLGALTLSPGPAIGLPAGHPGLRPQLCPLCTPMVWALQLAREDTAQETPPEVTFLGGDDGDPVIVCPHCRAHDSICDHDEGIRALQIEWTRRADRGRIAGFAGPSGDFEHEHVRYFCSACGRSVTVPGEAGVVYG